MTSGTAVGEILPAVMEAYYTCQPLLIISADRPTRFRGSGAPQACTQPGIFGIYAPFLEDISTQSTQLRSWDQRAPAHLNACFEEPKDIPGKNLSKPQSVHTPSSLPLTDVGLDSFLRNVTYPLIVVGEVAEEDRDSVEEFLLKLNAPIICEPPSGLNARTSLKPLQISRRTKILEHATHAGYPIDGVLRIGGVPTLRLWRDLENMGGKIPVLSLTRWPFSGLSFNQVAPIPLSAFLDAFVLPKTFQRPEFLNKEKEYLHALQQLYELFPLAEQTLFHNLSANLKHKHTLYLGNSLPIRYWDQFGAYNQEEVPIAVNRGLNGIDGQLSTALGFADDAQENWIVLGDLTTLYDLTAPWFLKQLKGLNMQLVVVNNSGGQIFSEMYKNPAFQNQHNIQFKSFAEMWNLQYELWKSIPLTLTSDKSRIIELVPDSQQTKAFTNALKGIIV